MNSLIVDPGYSNMKFATLNNGRVHAWKEPSAVAEMPDWALQVDMPQNQTGGEVKWQGKKWMAGSEALMAGLPIPLTSGEALWKIALPVFLLKHTLLKPEAKVVVLLSPADWGKKDRIKSILAQAGFSDVRFLPQGLGIWIIAGAPSDACVVDIGFNTVDVLFAQGGRLLKDLSISIKGAGLIALLSKLERDDPFMLARRLENGDARLAEVIQTHYWNWLQRQLQARPEWNTRPGTKIYAGGGGALFLKQGQVKVVKSPELANVLGVAELIRKEVKGHANEA